MSDEEQDYDLEKELPPGTGVDEEESIEGADVIHDPFDPSLIRVERATPSIDLLIKRIKRSEINLSPDFQRKGGIWTDEAQSRLIESLLIRIPLPAFYVDATEEDSWLVVDGLQRLTTLKRFIVDQDLRLKGLEFLKEGVEGKKFDELPRAFQRRIEETEVTIFTIQAGTPEKVKFNIFKRINTGGLPLSAQEIRNALNGDRVRDMLIRMVNSNEFKKATANGIKDKRMADRECATRFLAFILNDPKKYTLNDFDAFLNQVLSRLNNPDITSDSEMEILENKFKISMRRAKQLLDKYAFRKYYGPGYRLAPINKALFESWSVNLANLQEDQFRKLMEKRDLVMKRYVQLIKDEYFSRSISASTGAPAAIKERFGSITKLLMGVITSKND